MSTFDSVFENLRFCVVFVQINVNTFTKTEVFLSICVQKRCSVRGLRPTCLKLTVADISALFLGDMIPLCLGPFQDPVLKGPGGHKGH